MHITAVPERGCKLIGGEATSSTNSNKGCADNRKINMHSIRETFQPVIINTGVHGPDEFHSFDKINLDSTYLKPKNLLKEVTITIR